MLGREGFGATLRVVPAPNGPRPREARLTLALIAVCFAWFIWTFAVALSETGGSGLMASLWNLAAPGAFERTGGLVVTRVWLDGEWWRVVTAGFVHGSWLHLGLNTWALWDVGRWTERAWGSSVQLLLFGVSSVGGCLASLAWVEAPIVVGASAGIFGVASALVVTRRFGAPAVKAKLAPIASGRLAFWLVLWLVVGWQIPVLANAGHLGGAVVGLGVGFALAAGRLWVRIGAWLATGALLSGLALVGRGPTFRPNYALFTGLELLERGDTAAGYARLEVALESMPADPVVQNAVAYSLALQGVELERALALSLASLEADPGRADYLDTLGWIYCRMGRVEEGLAQLEAAAGASIVPIAEVAEHLTDCADAVID